MFNWLKKLFGSKTTTTESTVTTDNAALNETVVVNEPALVLEEEQRVEEAPKPKKTTKKSKKSTVDLTVMSKTELLTLCKERGIKANASLKKEELINRLS